MKKLCLAIFGLIVLSPSSPAYSANVESGTVDSGGGDAIVLEFLETARKIQTWLESNPSNIPGLDADSFNQKLKQLKLSTTSEALYINGDEVDALNFPKEVKVIVNRLRWSHLVSSYQKVSFVVHEFLGLLEVNDALYAASAKVGAQILASKHEPTQYFRCLSVMEIFDHNSKLIASDQQAGTIQYQPITGGNSVQFQHSFNGERIKLQGSMSWETFGPNEPGHATLEYMMIGRGDRIVNAMFFNPTIPSSIGVSFGRFVEADFLPGNRTSLRMICTEQ